MSPTLDIRGSIPEIVGNKEGLYDGDLVHYFRAVFNHATNLCNPYHNFRHVCHVLWLCYQACKFYSRREQLSSSKPVFFSEGEMRNLLIAALFHDFDHTGKPGPDAVNIARAVAGFERHIASVDRDELEKEKITRLIKITEYPYVIPWEKLNLAEQVLRDADMSQALSVAWIQQVVFGLAMEWGKSPLEVLKLQGKFHGSLEFRTEWARNMFPRRMVEAKIIEAQALVDLLNGEKIAAAV